MTPSILLLKGVLVLSLLALCFGQADDRWSWNDPRGGGQYTVAKTLVARREPSKQPLFQIARDPLNNKARYEVLEEGDKGLGSFLNRPDRFPDDRGPFPGNNPGFDRPRPGIDDRRPGFGDRRPGLGSFNPDFNRPELGVARPILPGDGLNLRPDFDRPGPNNNRPLFQGNNRPGFDGNRPNFGGFRPDFDNRGPIGERPPPPGFNGRPKPSPTGGNAPGILTGPVPSWEKPHGKKDPTDFDSCKCKHSFNCKSPGIQFGTCDVGKQYCCHNSPKYGLTEGDGRRPVLIGPGPGPDLIQPRGGNRQFNP